MKTIADDLWMCCDCLPIVVNGDATTLDYHYTPLEAAQRLIDIGRGIEGQGGHIVEDFDSETGEGIEEFSRRDCDICGCDLAGTRYRYALLEAA